MVGDIILEDVVTKVIIVASPAGVAGSLELLEYNPAREIVRQAIEPIIMLSPRGRRQRHPMVLSQDDSSEVPPIEPISIVHEYMGIFPAELPGMPPDRDIDFCIDLELGTHPSSIPPYRMTLAELKSQIQELLGKVFIRLSASPWSQKEQEVHLRIVLGLLREKRLYAKLPKYEFWLDLVCFLEHLVSKDGVMVDPHKIKVVKSWAKPTNVSEGRWIELLKAMEEIKEQKIKEDSMSLEKAHVVVDALSKKSRSMESLAHLQGEENEVVIDEESILRIKGWVCGLRIDNLIQTIIIQAHSSRRRCRSHISWFDEFEVRPWEIDLLRESLEKMKFIHEKLLAAQSRQKEYADQNFMDMEFIEEEQVLLSVSPMKGVKYHGDRNYIIHWDSVLLDENLSYEEEPVAILYREVRKLRSREIASMKVQWRNCPVVESTWDIEADICGRYPYLFV
ncbi:uncharacterized protein LOC129892760 [Solanum dulcamara]|uniref:uncharacterized protein LOC129892760 n=1 Tax=Solanum dulcamara TaxID=45834 RepID=UPI002486B363|nr:uncharacterized protein LOC129892760 [Solanum dulcamara]